MVDAAAPAGIWGNTTIPIVAVTGERFSGKTLFVSSIHPMETLMIDLNRSSETYSIPYKRRFDPYHDWQTQDVLAASFHPQRPSFVDIFLWFCRTCDAIQPGQFSVIAIDPITDIEVGLAEWIQQNPHEFGRTGGQYAKSPALLQTDIASWWKTFLTHLSAKIETFTFTADVGRQHSTPPAADNKNGTPDTLFDLASLHLHTERRPAPSGRMKGIPSARVLKSRLARTTVLGGYVQYVPILPPYLSVATPNTIRKYINKPADYTRLKKSERIPQDVLSDDARLSIKAQTASDEKDTAQLQLAQLVALTQATEAQTTEAPAANSPVTDSPVTDSPAADSTRGHNEQQNVQAVP